MNDNDLIEESQYSQYPQQGSQSTQPASQQATDDDFNDQMWGYLEPWSREVPRINFFLDKSRYKVGRCEGASDCILPGMLVSGVHCIITWDGTYQSASVTVLDISKNGTFINGENIGCGNTALLRHGSEISFRPPGAYTCAREDYRFTYRHIANPPITTFATKYDLLTDIGRGSYGVVKKALCRSSGEYVAVKILKDTKSIHDQKSRPRSHYFLREFEVLQKLKHKNICELKEAFFCDDSGDICLILELVEGGNLYAHLLQYSPLGEVNAQYFTYQICDALAYIHSQNAAHRDLKPENILLTKDNPPIVKVTDFGLSKFVDSQTMLRTLCGTPEYLAPEIVRQENAEGYDNLVDSWSVGVMVFIMLAGDKPFIGDEGPDLRTRVLGRTIDWSLLMNNNTSHEANDFIWSLLQGNPRERMALTNALKHPWFEGYTPVYGRKTNFSSDIPFSGYSMIPPSGLILKAFNEYEYPEA